MEKNRCILIEEMGIDYEDIKVCARFCIKHCPFNNPVFCILDIPDHIEIPDKDIEKLKNKAKELKGESKNSKTD